MLVSCMQTLDHHQFLRLSLRTWLIPLEPFFFQIQTLRGCFEFPFYRDGYWLLRESTVEEHEPATSVGDVE